ncbi:hypothetical protein Tco_0865466 [Tanacetum coccineum]
MYMAKIQEVLHATDDNSGPTYDTEPLEKKDKEAAELKCKEALDLQACNTHKNAESLKTEAYRTFLVKEENAKLVNQISIQERQISNIESEKEELKKDFQKQEDKDMDKQIDLENQVNILSNIVYKTSQSAQTVFMLTPKPSSYYNGRCSISFENPEYLKKAQWEKPCLYNVQYDKNDLANMFAPESEETIRLAEMSRSKLEKHCINLELALQNEKEKIVCEKSWVKQSFTSRNNEKVLKAKNDSLIVELNRKTIEINDLKAQLQDKTIVNAKMQVLLNKAKGKYVDTKFEKPSVVRQPNAFRFQKSSVMGKPSPFANSLERQFFPKSRFVPTTHEKKDLSKPVTPQILPS